MFNKIRNWFMPEKPASPSLYQEAVFRYRVMSLPDASVYGEIRMITVLYDRIRSYESELRKAIRALEENIPFVSSPGERQIYLPHFYFDDNGGFLNPKEAQAQFIEQAILFLELYERKENALEQDRILQMNLYRLAPIVTNVIELSEALTP